ncbi:MAG TPA: lipopolysaccharide kinase InaA family protein [Azoarcus taiwanensis]|nr:lipopolysaccharide kinase InaA family protein [Azoarcus taiwanensis]
MANKLQWRFIAANLRALLTGQFSMPRGHVPSGGHRVPNDFCGVGVATNPDPLTDDAVISALHDLGVRQVRLDVTYGDLDNHVARFLERLLKEDFKVMLHILQPFEAARAMPSPEATTQWRDFLIATLDRFGSQVEIIELCSTINRTRWAGYRLEGFLSAWRVGHDEVRERNLVLAGPSITDFEPPWTVGVLDMLARENLLPDIHTDNLFAERATEPERWDQKLLGPRLAPLLGVNLVKKAHLLARFGARAGVPRMMSPAAFWTLPRIERMLPDSEQKQADYLARYLLLCAASGALERTYWGPLVCHREGLIDDGDHPYPKLERITHYARIEGSTSDFRRRPAFAALVTFNRLIPGTDYLGKIKVQHDKRILSWPNASLEIHAFRSDTQLIHAVWTTNGDTAAACDLYVDADLTSARYLDRDGEPLVETPTLFTESPVYLVWPAETTIETQPGAKLLPGIRIHRHQPGLSHYYHRDIEWHGMVLARSRTEADQLIGALHPEHIGTPPSKNESLRLSRNAIWTVPDPRQPDRFLVAKKPVKHHLHKKLLDRLKPSKARRSWSGAAELQRRGLTTANPVGWFEQRSGNDITRNWYLCEHVIDATPAGRLFASLASHPAPERSERDALYGQLAGFVRTMHERGVQFRDLSAGNILIQQSGYDYGFRLIDTARIQTFPRSVSRARRLSDLTRVTHKLDEAGRRSFLQFYFGSSEGVIPVLVRLRFALYSLRATIKRRLRHTRLYRAMKS